jgi:hypothetical protein
MADQDHFPVSWIKPDSSQYVGVAEAAGDVADGVGIPDAGTTYQILSLPCPFV